MPQIKRVNHPLRQGAVLLDENGRKWIIHRTGEWVSSDYGLKNLTLEPDHSGCNGRMGCTHYGEQYL